MVRPEIISPDGARHFICDVQADLSVNAELLSFSRIATPTAANVYEMHGPELMQPGSCWIQPPGIRHTVVGWSDDCELLEVILPAEHETVNDD